MIFDPHSLPDYADRLEAARLYAVYSVLFDIWNDGPENVNPAGVRADMQAAYDAYIANGVHLYTDGEGWPISCGASDVPLLASDELVEDCHTGELFLRSAIGLPPRPTEAAEVEMAEAV